MIVGGLRSFLIILRGSYRKINFTRKRQILTQNYTEYKRFLIIMHTLGDMRRKFV